MVELSPTRRRPRSAGAWLRPKRVVRRPSTAPVGSRMDRAGPGLPPCRPGPHPARFSPCRPAPRPSADRRPSHRPGTRSRLSGSSFTTARVRGARSDHLVHDGHHPNRRRLNRRDVDRVRRGQRREQHRPAQISGVSSATMRKPCAALRSFPVGRRSEGGPKAVVEAIAFIGGNLPRGPVK